ncbi:ArsR/SmtB family transcription factor [Halothiobacillus sp.]|uniref:ArsR/SmtB family transcription factor n=1 Tax=Halothiobacillus sp. TaxID=1891311 RepID=UPI0026317784|nr:metalloregulator ArsR/SmtB family transcription factor [Halothiobacillus sp.]MDD3576437.1 metalloregulator ArsR/SmtB family transcription factor [Halothiobacillus sp.]MDD4966288.1 metalloregulator ArsR/SmtB family transcription factor [Halothiobacillus sp.]
MAFKQDLNDQFARMGKVLGSGRRLELLDYLAQAPRSVEQLAEVSGLTIANTSQHLQKMQQAGLVRANRQGKYIIYQLADGEVVTLLNTLHTLADRHLAEVRALVATHLAPRDALAPITLDELQPQMAAGDITLIDVRPPQEFAAGHLPSAVNIPPDQLASALDRLDPTRPVVAYCRGRYCAFSYDAVAALRERGFSARRLAVGFPEWQLAGHSVIYPATSPTNQASL